LKLEKRGQQRESPTIAPRALDANLSHLSCANLNFEHVKAAATWNSCVFLPWSISNNLNSSRSIVPWFLPDSILRLRTEMQLHNLLIATKYLKTFQDYLNLGRHQWRHYSMELLWSVHVAWCAPTTGTYDGQ
jgi:hypothetical protein